MKKRQFDIILFGATSFVGRLVTRHLQSLLDSESPAIPKDFTWAIAARNEKVLQQVKESLGENESNVEIMVDGDGDPGYSSTARMLTQAALSIAVDVDANTPGGFYTPAALPGEALIKRLTDYAATTFTIK